MGDIRDCLQGASNSAAATVSGPVDGINWLLKKAGLPVSDKPVGGSEWMKETGLTQEPKNKLAAALGEAASGAVQISAAAKAKQLAKLLVK